MLWEFSLPLLQQPLLFLPRKYPTALLQEPLPLKNSPILSLRGSLLLLPRKYTVARNPQQPHLARAHDNPRAYHLRAALNTFQPTSADFLRKVMPERYFLYGIFSCEIVCDR